MKATFPDVVEKGRHVSTPSWPQHVGDRYGVFTLRHPDGAYLCVIAASAYEPGHDDPGSLWDHVSVSVREEPVNRCPTWEEMCWVKDLFWDHSECVVQFHPSRSEYINRHEFVLHMWRDSRRVHETPPTILV